MALRSSEMSLRNELVRYQLDDAIRATAGGQHQDKNGCSSRLMIDQRFMVGIIRILKFSFKYKNLLTTIFNLSTCQAATGLQLMLRITL